MRVLGISAFYHDAAAALVDEGRIIAADQYGGLYRFTPPAANQPLDTKDPPVGPPRPLQGGLPFDPTPGDEKAGRSWLGPVVLGGAALVTTIGVAVGVARSRRAAAAH